MPDHQGLNAIIAEIERRIAVGNKRLAEMPCSSCMTREYGFQITGLGAALSLLTALRDAVRERREAFTAQQQQPGYGPGDDESYAWQYAIDQLSWVIGPDQ